jgi:hypothetical protein
MRVRLTSVLLGLALAAPGCDRIQALKDQFTGSPRPQGGADPELEAVKNLYQGGRYDEALSTVAAVISRTRLGGGLLLQGATSRGGQAVPSASLRGEAAASKRFNGFRSTPGMPSP